MRESEQQVTGGIGIGVDRAGQDHYGRDAPAATESGGNRDSAEDGSGGSGGSGSPLLKAMLDNFHDPCLEKMLERLDAILTESTSYTKNPAAMRHEVSI